MDIFALDWNITAWETEVNDTCLNPRFQTSDWVTISLPIALVIIIFFSFLQPRKKLALGCLYSRPGIVYPVDVLDTYTERTTFALAFCVCCISILDLFVGNFYFSVDTTHLPSMVRGAVSTLLGFVNVLIVGVVHYPLLLCLTVRRKLYGNIVGLLYSSFWSFFYYIGFVDCVRGGKWLSPQNIVRNLAIFPIDLCYIYLNFRFLFGIIYYLGVCKNTCRKYHESNINNETMMQDVKFEKTHFYRRVTFLLQPSNKWKSSHPSPSRFMLLVRKLYPSYPGFKYSRRIVCTITLSLLCLYEFGLLYTIVFSSFMAELKDAFVLPENSPLFLAIDAANVSSVYFNSRDFIVTLADTLMPTSLICLIFMAASTIHVLINYRNNTVRMWGGDRSSFPVQAYSYSSKVVANLTYSGYQIAYCIWGFIVLHLVLWVVVVVVWYFILGPLINNVRRDNVILQLLRDYWLGLVITYIIYYSQILASRLFFLQKYGKNFGINNRRSYHNMVYFTLFLNVLVGFVSCLLRVLKALLFGIFLVGRVDYCLMYPGLEFFDKGYRAYVGFLELEVIHTHPVIVTFCHCLWQVARTESDRRSALEKTEDEHQVLERRRRKVVRNKWQLGYTLVRNPILLRDRLSNLIGIQGERETGIGNGGFTIEMDSVEGTTNPLCSSEEYQALEMKPSNRGRGQHRKIQDLVAMKAEECTGEARSLDSQGEGITPRDYSSTERHHEEPEGHDENDFSSSRIQEPSIGKGISAGNIHIGQCSPCTGHCNTQSNVKTGNANPEENIHDPSRGMVDVGLDEGFRTLDSNDPGTDTFWQANPNVHHRPDHLNHIEAIELPVDDCVQNPESNKNKGLKSSGCRGQLDESDGDEDREGDFLESSQISVFSNQSFEDLLETSLDPDHIADCIEQGVDLVSYVEEEMWKNLLHEGSSTLKRVKQEEQKTHHPVVEEKNGEVPKKDSTAEISERSTKHLEE
ncbi:stimulated by retinoic acid gene 6 protein-like isoform X1 [Strongylocentrotus purpuratus]|uniref:Receptor for retinol uptake STRA6 n=1 Tax=Strongylocentrotus purpuratus TaxID=7668 RepID=A0A7M7N895_STRPU|nr:stimulated by retinoic acid gene 6 protein-like isoform X1 [Strongylocentrotus purpuratus]